MLGVPPETIGRWTTLWGCPGLEAGVTLRISPRLRRSLARCDRLRRQLRVHPALLAQPLALREEVLCHELAHLAVFVLHGGAVRPHGPEWRALLVGAGFAARTRVALVVEPTATVAAQHAAAPLRPRFRHRCPVCGATRCAARRVPRWRCRACRAEGLEGLLEIEPVARP